MNIPHDISQYSHHFKDYTELRVQENRVARISLTNGDVTGNVSSAQSGVSARVFKDGNWGFSSAPEFNDHSVGRVVKSSTENVRFMNLKDTSRCGLILPDTMADYEMDFSTKKPRENQKYWVDFCPRSRWLFGKEIPRATLTKCSGCRH